MLRLSGQSACNPPFPITSSSEEAKRYFVSARGRGLTITIADDGFAQRKGASRLLALFREPFIDSGGRGSAGTTGAENRALWVLSIGTQRGSVAQSCRVLSRFRNRKLVGNIAVCGLQIVSTVRTQAELPRACPLPLRRIVSCTLSLGPHRRHHASLMLLYTTIREQQ